MPQWEKKDSQRGKRGYHLWYAQQKIKQKMLFKQGDFFDFFPYVLNSTLLHLPPLRFHCVATSALTVRRSNHLVRSHPHGQISSTAWLDLIHTWLNLIHNLARSHPQLGQILSKTWLDLIHTWLDLIHNLTRSHPQPGQISSTTWLDLIHNLARSHPKDIVIRPYIILVHGVKIAHSARSNYSYLNANYYSEKIKV